MNEIELGVVPERNCKVVSDPVVARRLLRNGYKIVDIKAKRRFERETVFVFEVTDNFMGDYEKYLKERKDKLREEKKEEAQ